MRFSIPQANLPKMYSEYSLISCWLFLPMWSLLSKPLYIPMRRRKMYFLVHKLIRNRSSWGPCHFLIFVTKHLVKNIPIYLSGNMKEFKWKKSGKAKNLYGNVQDFEKMKNMEQWWIWLKKLKNLYGKILKCEEFAWKCEGFSKKNEKYMEKMTNSSQKWKNLYDPTVF